MTNETQIAEQVAERLEGKKLYVVRARETVYYRREVYATSEFNAEEVCSEDGDWGDIVDGNDFEVYDVEEQTGVN